MLGTLSTDQIEGVLHTEVVGRIGCHADELTYVVPVTFAYHEGCVYGHSINGLKVKAMRTNPSVCFEVEHIDDLANWHTVIAWGRYEELDGHDAAEGLRILAERFAPLMASATSQPTHGADPGGTHAVVYRIHLTEKTGRFERSS